MISPSRLQKRDKKKLLNFCFVDVLAISIVACLKDFLFLETLVLKYLQKKRCNTCNLFKIIWGWGSWGLVGV